MRTPDVVVFDLGKVLVDFDYRIAARKIAARGRMSAEAVKQFIDHSPLLFRYETSQIDKQQFFEAVCEATGFRGTLEEFCRFFADIFTPIEPMIALHAQLRARGIPTFIFSNTNELAVAHIRQNFPFFARFDGYVYSYEQRAMKPEAKIYEVVERLTGHAGAEILYLDDRQENAEAGVARGWQVIQHETPEKTLPVFWRLNLLPAKHADGRE